MPNRLKIVFPVVEMKLRTAVVLISSFATLLHLCVCAQLLSHAQLFVTPQTAAHQAPPSLGFSRQEHWSGLPFPSPRDLPHLGIRPLFPALAGGFFTTEPLGGPRLIWRNILTECKSNNALGIYTYKLFFNNNKKKYQYNSRLIWD